MRADAQRNRDRIVEVAREVFREQGYDASLDEVAKRAGVGAGHALPALPEPREPARRDHAELGRPGRRGRRQGARPRGTAARPAAGAGSTAYVALISLHKGGPAKITSAMGDPASPIVHKCQVLTAATDRVVARLRDEDALRERRRHRPDLPARRRRRRGRRPGRTSTRAAVRPLLEVVADGLLTPAGA